MMVATFISDFGQLHLPFVQEFEVSTEYDDKEYTNILGDTYIIAGKEKPKSLELTGFISLTGGKFYNILAPRHLESFKTFFNRARQTKTPLRLIIATPTTTVINILCYATFKHGNVDSVGDIPYTITVKEYKKMGV